MKNDSQQPFWEKHLKRFSAVYISLINHIWMYVGLVSHVVQVVVDWITWLKGIFELLFMIASFIILIAVLHWITIHWIFR